MPMPKTIRQEMQEAWDAIIAARADKTITVQEWLRMISEILDVPAKLCRDVAGDDDAFESLVVEAEEFVTEVVVPFDIPGIPPFVERYVVDPQIPLMVRPILMWTRTELIKGMKPDEVDRVDPLPTVDFDTRPRPAAS